jgi:hypothetical protein
VLEENFPRHGYIYRGEGLKRWENLSGEKQHENMEGEKGRERTEGEVWRKKSNGKKKKKGEAMPRLAVSVYEHHTAGEKQKTR